MNDINLSVIATRAAKTFTQAFIAVFLAGVTPIISGITNKDFSSAKAGLVALVVAALAAGVSALMNLFIKPQENK